MNKSRYSVALVALVALAASNLAYAGGPVAVGINVGFAVGAAVGSVIAQFTGLPIETIGGGTVFAIAAIALVAGIRLVRRQQGR